LVRKTEAGGGGGEGGMYLHQLFDSLLFDTDTGKDQDLDTENKVVLMTLHLSKGLEWPNVFIVGCDEGMMPYYRSSLEEERRLFYVGLTRARNSLCLTYPQRCLLFNKPMITTRSSFFYEMLN
jgi:superfamily I DNA/RNA helicase